MCIHIHTQGQGINNDGKDRCCLHVACAVATRPFVLISSTISPGEQDAQSRVGSEKKDAIIGTGSESGITSLQS